MILVRVCILLFISMIIAPNCLAQNFHTAKVKSPAAGTMFIYPERIPLKAGGPFTVERGLIFVPVNRGSEASGVLAVEVYRFRRSAKANSDAPPLFILNGGPGFTGLEKPLAKPGSEAMKANPEFKQSLEQFIATGETKDLPEVIELPPIDWVVPKFKDSRGNDDD